MPTTPAYPSELLESEQLAALIASAKERYDFVLFDSPPLLAVTDAAVLASRVDGVVLVVKGNAIPRELLRQAMAMLADVKATVVGTAVTADFSLTNTPGPTPTATPTATATATATPTLRPRRDE